MTDASAGLPAIAGEVARALLGSPNRQLSTRRQLRFGRKGALAVEVAGPRRGTWHDHSAGEGGGVLDLIARERGGGRAEAFAWLKQQRLVADTGIESISTSAPTETDATAVQHAVLAPWGHRIWSQSRPITLDDPAGKYLLGRGCALPPRDGDLRWHPTLKHRSGHVGPGLIGLITDVLDAGRAINIHRTWLAADGSAKAELDDPRLTLKDHTTRGGCVRLWPDDAVEARLTGGEGIETVLAAARTHPPAWSFISAGLLKALPVLPGVEFLTIVCDHDPAGIDATREAGARWRDAGAEVEVLFPTKPKTDWADLASKEGS